MGRSASCSSSARLSRRTSSRRAHRSAPSNAGNRTSMAFTAEEKRQHGETRQAKCYFTDVSFNPKTFKKKSRDAAAAKGQQTIAPPAKKPKVMEPSNAPPAPKAEEAAKPPAAPADEVEDKEVEDWYAKATTPPVPAS